MRMYIVTLLSLCRLSVKDADDDVVAVYSLTLLFVFPVFTLKICGIIIRGFCGCTQITVYTWALPATMMAWNTHIQKAQTLLEHKHIHYTILLMFGHNAKGNTLKKSSSIRLLHDSTRVSECTMGKSENRDEDLVKIVLY